MKLIWDRNLFLILRRQPLPNSNDFSISRNCFDDRGKTVNTAVYQLHGFCDASNLAFICDVYLRRVVNGESQVAFVLGKSKLVLTHQANWVIARKVLEAAKLCCELTSKAAAALSHLNCSVHLWTDSQVILKWITNPDLHLVRFVKRRVDKILAFFCAGRVEVCEYFRKSC